MTALLDRLDKVVSSEELKKFNIGIKLNPTFDRYYGVVQMTVLFDLPIEELDRLTDHGLEANMKQKVRIAAKSIIRQATINLGELK